eukprot:TRINITY_DN18414_c0_g1_i1.p1 TRINITY_DN18414_c0_g1~~TRINITY_DN18414_c0_g1_i1.p1  ORF type:complete len:485 (-),score=71.87 TRINITY_DN18414_c0_g1_i1:46-1500(-)
MQLYGRGLYRVYNTSIDVHDLSPDKVNAIVENKLLSYERRVNAAINYLRKSVHIHYPSEVAIEDTIEALIWELFGNNIVYVYESVRLSSSLTKPTYEAEDRTSAFSTVLLDYLSAYPHRTADILKKVVTRPQAFTNDTQSDKIISQIMNQLVVSPDLVDFTRKLLEDPWKSELTLSRLGIFRREEDVRIIKESVKEFGRDAPFTRIPGYASECILPSYILSEIFTYCQPGTLLNIAISNKLFHNISCSDDIWMLKNRQRNNGKLVDLAKNKVRYSSGNWKYKFYELYGKKRDLLHFSKIALRFITDFPHPSFKEYFEEGSEFISKVRSYYLLQNMFESCSSFDAPFFVATVLPKLTSSHFFFRDWKGLANIIEKSFPDEDICLPILHVIQEKSLQYLTANQFLKLINQPTNDQIRTWFRAHQTKQDVARMFKGVGISKMKQLLENEVEQLSIPPYSSWCSNEVLVSVAVQFFPDFLSTNQGSAG